MFKKISKLLVFGALATALTAPLSAQESVRGPDRTVEVHFGDLDIDRDEDLGVLKSRIEKAVRKVCRAPMQGPVKTTTDPRDCRVAAREDAQIQLARILATVSVDEYASNNIVVSRVSQARN